VDGLFNLTGDPLLHFLGICAGPWDGDGDNVDSEFGKGFADHIRHGHDAGDEDDGQYDIGEDDVPGKRSNDTLHEACSMIVSSRPGAASFALATVTRLLGMGFTKRVTMTSSAGLRPTLM